MNKMRFSPILLAACAAVSAAGWSTSAQAQSSESVTNGAVASRTMVAKLDLDTQPVVAPEATDRPAAPLDGATKPAIAKPVVESVTSATGIETAPIAQVSGQGTSSQVVETALIAQVPEQDTPNQIQLNPPKGTANPSLPTIPTPAPTPTPASPTPPTTIPTPPADAGQPEPRVLVSEVVVTGAEGALQDEVYQAIQTRPGRTTTRTQLQEDINAVFATGFFSNVKATPEDTPLGVRVTFEVQTNPVLKSVQLEGNKIVPQKEIDRIFSPQYGTTLNLRRLQTSIQDLNKWYQDNGFVLAQVVDVPQVASDGSVTLEVAEGVIEGLQVRYLNKQGEEKDDKGRPIRGRTRDFIVLREFELKPGEVFNRNKAERDLQRAFGLGIFEDLKLALVPGQDPRKVIVQVNAIERNTGSVGLAAGVSSASGLFGSVSYQQQNLGGNNQKLSAEVQIGERERLFDVNFTDPWIAGDPYRTSYTLSAFRRQTISLIFDGGPNEVRLPDDPNDGDRPRIVRTGGGITFSRPLDKNPFKRSEWNASLGLQYQRVAIRDSEGELAPRDALGNLLSFNDSGKDDLFTAQLGFVRDRRNDPLRPTSGSVLRFGTEQSIPIGSGSIFLNRVRASYSFYIPVRFTRLTPGCQNRKPRIGEKPIKADCPQALAFNIQAGNVFGDLPPYEAFSMGGSSSVRGYDEGEVGSGRRFAQATLEYRFPVFSIISGALFVDAASDLGSGNLVPGSPAIVRGKPGGGIGYGLGVRVQSPLGPIRVDYGFNDQGESRLHFGIGERF
jgi:outer membrane protein insertion porin family